MKVLITPRSFAKHDKRALELLRSNNIEIVANPQNGILNEAQMRKCIAGCEGVIIGVDPLNARVMSVAPSLRAVAKYGVGVDNIDLAYCKQHGIEVSRTVGANSEAVADYAFALILSLARKVIPIDEKCRTGDWSKLTTSDVSRKTLGLIGLGAIGRQMVKRAKGFSMNILAYDVVWDDTYAKEEGVVQADIDTICGECDFISLHLPLLPDTRLLIDGRRIALMRPNACLINTARGGLIDDGALLAALRENRIAGAGLDAFAQEPPEDKEWFSLKNVIIGSHCAASTSGAADNMSWMAACNLLRGLGFSDSEFSNQGDGDNV